LLLNFLAGTMTTRTPERQGGREAGREGGKEGGREGGREKREEREREVRGRENQDSCAAQQLASALVLLHQ
jgi:hypothetical protein